MHGGQDWDPVIIRKKPASQAAAKDEASVNAARRTGAAVETSKKCTNAKGSAQGKSAAKLDNETEDFHHEKVSSDLKKQIIAARTAKKLTQAQLAQQINERPQLVQEYESGKAIPNPQVLGKMSRVLGVVLKRAPAGK